MRFGLLLLLLEGRRKIDEDKRGTAISVRFSSVYVGI